VTELQRTAIQPDNVFKSTEYPFSQAIRVQAGKLLFIAGQPSIDIDGNVVGVGDMAAQTRQAYKNIGNVLASAGATFTNVVELTTLIVGRENLPAHLEVISELYDDLFPDGVFPTDTVALVDGLYLEDFLIEIKAVAVLD
jgi:enamine deaminase RidA (YjgF/YER057c/UK114 family)